LVIRKLEKESNHVQKTKLSHHKFYNNFIESIGIQKILSNKYLVSIESISWLTRLYE